MPQLPTQTLRVIGIISNIPCFVVSKIISYRNASDAKFSVYLPLLEVVVGAGEDGGQRDAEPASALPSFSAKRIGFATETLILPHQAFFVRILYTNV